MGEGFKRLKRKYLIDAITKALLVFVSVALLIIATFLIVIKQGKLEFSILYAVLIGVASGLLLGLVTFLAFHKGDKRLAKRLDQKLGLNEMVQTMHAFKDDEGEIKELQRAHTQSVLDADPIETSSFIKGLIVFIVACVLAVTYFTVSLVMYFQGDTEIPAPPDSSQGGTDSSDDKPPVVDEPFEPTVHQKKELEALIEYVSTSQLRENAKTAVVSELTVLLERIDTFGTEATMKEYVVGIIKNVRSAVNSVSSTYAFYNCVKSSGNESLSQLSLALYALNLNAVEAEIEEYRNIIRDEDGNVKPKESLEEILDEIEAMKNGFAVVLESSGLTEEDSLYTLILNLKTVLETILEKSKSPANVGSRLDAPLTEFLDGLKQIVPVEKIDEDVKVYTVDELKRIFDITEEDLNTENEGTGGVITDEPEGRPEIGDGGGFGTGDINVGSDDVVIDPDNVYVNDDLYVKYGEIIGEYSAKINEMINSGELTEEQAAILREYLTILLTPSEN